MLTKLGTEKEILECEEKLTIKVDNKKILIKGGEKKALMCKKHWINYLSRLKRNKAEFLFSNNNNKELFFVCNENNLVLFKKEEVELKKLITEYNDIEDYKLLRNSYLPLKDLGTIKFLNKNIILTNDKVYFLKNNKLFHSVINNFFDKCEINNSTIKMYLGINPYLYKIRNIKKINDYDLIETIEFDFKKCKYYFNKKEIEEKIFFKTLKNYKKSYYNSIYYSFKKNRYLSHGGLNQFYSIKDKKTITPKLINFSKNNFFHYCNTFYYRDETTNLIKDYFTVNPNFKKLYSLNQFEVKEKIFLFNTQETYFVLNYNYVLSRPTEYDYLVIKIGSNKVICITEAEYNYLTSLKAKLSYLNKLFLRGALNENNS